MSARHTPGPWAVWEDPDDARAAPTDGGIADAPCGVLVAESGLSIADLWFGTDCEYHVSRDEVFANARLIAAAPDMLAALRDAQTALAMMTAPKAIKTTSVQHAFAQAVAAETKARAAIAKAEGRS